jgi:hypothetical protein
MRLALILAAATLLAADKPKPTITAEQQRDAQEARAESAEAEMLFYGSLNPEQQKRLNEMQLRQITFGKILEGYEAFCKPGTLDRKKVQCVAVPEPPKPEVKK